MRTNNRPLAVLLVILVLSMIFAAIRPAEHAHAMHLIQLPCPLISGAISPSEGPLPMFLALLVLPTVFAAIGPALDAPAILPVVTPLAFIVSPICVEVVSRAAMRLVTKPVSLVAVSVGQGKATKARGLTRAPQT
jgi:hypothetical protein